MAATIAGLFNSMATTFAKRMFERGQPCKLMAEDRLPASTARTTRWALHFAQ